MFLESIYLNGSDSQTTKLEAFSKVTWSNISFMDYKTKFPGNGWLHLVVEPGPEHVCLIAQVTVLWCLTVI